MINVKVFAEGDQVCAMIGENLQEGLAGFGEKPSQALRELASEIEKDPMTLAVLILRGASQKWAESQGDGPVVNNVVEFKVKVEDEKPTPKPSAKGGPEVELPNISDREFVDAFVKHIHPAGIPCAHCGLLQGFISDKNPRRYKCDSCGKSGSVFKDTIFAHNQQPLAAWALLIHMMMQAERPTTAQVQESLGVVYKVLVEINESKYRQFFSEIYQMVENSSAKMKPMGKLSI